MIAAVGDGRDARAHLLLRARLELLDAGLDGVAPVAVDERGEAALADGQRGGLRLDVADALIGDADVGQDDGEDLLVHLAALEELDRREAQPFLLHLGGVGGEAAGHHAAGVRPVAGVGEPREQLALVEVGLHEAHVHQVGAAEIGVVDDVEVARREVAGALDHRLGAELHGADEDGKAELALGNQLAGGGVVDAVGAIQRLGDHRAERGPHESQVHLVAHLLQAVVDHRQGDRIESVRAGRSVGGSVHRPGFVRSGCGLAHRRGSMGTGLRWPGCRERRSAGCRRHPRWPGSPGAAPSWCRAAR